MPLLIGGANTRIWSLQNLSCNQIYSYLLKFCNRKCTLWMARIKWMLRRCNRHSPKQSLDVLVGSVYETERESSVELSGLSNFHFSTNEELKKGKGSLRRLPLKKLDANRICTRGAFSPILGPPNRETDRWPKFKSHPWPEPSRLWLHVDTWKRDGDGNLSPKRAYLNWPRETRSEEKKDVWVREQRPDRWNLNQKAG